MLFLAHYKPLGATCEQREAFGTIFRNRQGRRGVQAQGATETAGLV